MTADAVPAGPDAPGAARPVGSAGARAETAGERGARSMTRPGRVHDGWLQATLWSRCAHCEQVISEGAWQGLADVPGVGRRWVHELCAHQLGVPARTQTPPLGGAPTGTLPDRAQTAAPATERGEPLRVLVVGSIGWPRARAVEVRDVIAGIVAVAALARRPVLLIHGGRVCPDTGRAAGVDAWTELTATRLGLETRQIGAHRDRHDRTATEARHQALVDAGADLVLAFPLHPDPATADAVARAEAAGLPVHTHP